MANIEIGGRLHSTATGNVVTGANEVLDDTKNKKQSVINAEVDETIGDDNTEGTIKGRIKTAEGKLDTLNGDSSTSGSVAKAVADAKTELIGGATSNGNTLKKVEDRTATLETAVGSNGSVDQRIAAAKSEVIGDAASDYNTLGKLEDKIQAEASARQDAITAETNRATTRENQIYDLVHTPEQHYVTVATYADLANIASPSDDTIYRVSSYNGNTSQVDNTVYSEYGYDGTNFVFLCVKSQIDEVYDISAHHSNNTYVDLAAALDGGNNIPQELRRGGMSVKFVQSSDNKYVQCRLMADEFTTDTTQWAIAEEGVYVDNPEFVYVKTDNDGKILWAIRTDGGIYYGAGCPQQVKDYIEEKISSLSLDEYEDIVVFLSDYLGSDTTLKAMIDGINDSISNLSNTKVDKVEGKSLIDAEYAFTKSTIDNPEFLEVTTDSEDKILEGIQQNGTKVIGGDLNVDGSVNINKGIRVLGNMEVSGVSYKVIENPEYLAAWVDAEDKVIFGLKTDGKTYVGDADFLNEIKNNQEAINEIKSYLVNFDNLDIDALSSITSVDNPEYIEAKTDSEGKLLAGRTSDGAAFENVGFYTPIVNTPIVNTPKIFVDGHTIENIEDPEERSEVTIDDEGKIISYRDTGGTKVENVGLRTPTIKLNSEGLSQLERDLKNNGFSAGIGDWSDYISEDGDKPLHLAMPTRAIINILSDFNLINLNKIGRAGGVQGVNYDIPTQIEFWDMQGNYFKKWALMSGQGNSSMSNAKKNIALDFFDTSVYDSKGKLGKGDAFSVKFGNWVAQDSYHLKANVSDTFRVTNNLTYKLYDAIVKTRGIRKDYMWKKALIDFSQIHSGGVDSEDTARVSLTNGARCFPDGFPVIVYQNGSFWGIFFMSLKKHRDNFVMNKKTAENIHLDGLLDSESIFMANGDVDWAMFTSKRANYEGRMDGIEVRNPKDLYCITPLYSYVKLVDTEEIRRAGISRGLKYCTDDKTLLSDAQIREQFGENPPVYFHNTSADEWYILHEGQSGSCSKYDADVNNHELIDNTMSCYDSSNKGHVRTNKVKKYIKNFSKIMTTINAAEQVYLASEKTAEDLAALKEVFETYFDVENLVDYIIIGDASNNWDGFRGKNWQWFSYDSVKWYCGLYDCDLTFSGAATIGTHVCEAPISMPQYTLLMNRYIVTYYQAELEARYKELRDLGILDKDFFINLAEGLIETIGKDAFEMEWEKWNFIPSDSIYRLQDWMEERLESLDIIYNYNN